MENRMDKKDKDIFESLGYALYAVNPYEKYFKTFTPSNGDCIELRIRTTSPEEQALYQGKYSAKARRRGGSVFGIGFEVFFGDDIRDLDKKMQEDAEEKCK
jgi:hypothetical protein